MPNDNEGSPENPDLIQSPEDQQDAVALADHGQRVDPSDKGPACYSVSVHLDPNTIAAIGVPWWTKLRDLWRSYTPWEKFKAFMSAFFALLLVSIANSIANKIVDGLGSFIGTMIKGACKLVAAWSSAICAAF